MLILIDLKNSDFSLGDEQDNSDGGLVTGQTDPDVGGVGVQQQLSFLVHLEEEVAGLDEELLLVDLGHLGVFLVTGD